MQVLFHCHRQFPEVRTPELLAKLVDVASSSGSSNRNMHSTGHVASSSALPVRSSSAVPARSSPPCVPVIGEVAAPERVEDALQDDDDDDDVESATIAVDDSNEETPRTTPPVGGGVSSSGTNQYPPPLLCSGLGCHGASGRSFCTCWLRGERLAKCKRHV
ncbi:hypothetical protein Ahy_B09g096440 isoform C [Arachis hypogaea]|uniref:Uncharacterized protein n=1 Tax=Arachis hypogaea TaxID=3818 RepID=A0A444XKL3_ARAHY|nr:hypothetical protein Ahy_B09g096440 isoform C [Arachis hypogaea]